SVVARDGGACPANTALHHSPAPHRKAPGTDVVVEFKRSDSDRHRLFGYASGDRPRCAVCGVASSPDSRCHAALEQLAAIYQGNRTLLFADVVYWGVSSLASTSD